MRSEAWEQLESYESSDVVSRLYAEVHGRPPNDGKPQELTSTLAQAREYFASAAVASELVRPLLLYYGVLGLSRWLILFREREAREATLSQSHGLTAQDWGNTITKGLQRFSETKTRVTKGGTFVELIAATRGQQDLLMVEGDDHVRWRQIVTTLPLPDKFDITPRQVLARLANVAGAYGESFDDSSTCREIYIDRHPASVRIHLQRYPGEDGSWVRRSFALPPTATITAVENVVLGGFPLLWEIVVQNVDLSGVLPMLPPLSAEGHHFITYDPLPGGVSLTKLPLLFVISFMMGMLVRYYPRQWLGFLHREEGDGAYPSLRAALRTVEYEFPARVYDSAAAMISFRVPTHSAAGVSLAASTS